MVRRRSQRCRGSLSRPNEWARTAEDVMWRRTKLGLRLTSAEAEDLARFMPYAG